MYGEELAADLALAWELYVTDEVIPIPRSMAYISSQTSLNVTTRVYTGVIDLIFDSITLAVDSTGIEMKPSKTVRFNNTITYVFDINVMQQIKVIVDTKGVSVVIKGYTPLSSGYSIRKSRRQAAPTNAFCGLINSFLTYKGTRKVSPIANYVYYWLNRDASNGTTAMGESDLNFSRATNSYETDKHLKVNATRNRLIRAWNDMCMMNKAVVEYLYQHRDDVKNYSFKGIKHDLLLSTQNVFNI